jgi:uncharacterized protein
MAETAICATPSLWPLDQQLTAVYEEALGGAGPAQRQSLQTAEENWIARRNQCNNNISCLNAAYVTQINALKVAIGGSRPAPAPGGGSQSASTFQNSCSDISVSGATLRANCRRINGSYDATSIALRGIENIDGTLMVTGSGASSFQNTCQNISISGAVLSAMCKRRDGSWLTTRLALPGIANIDGALQYQ